MWRGVVVWAGSAAFFLCLHTAKICPLGLDMAWTQIVFYFAGSELNRPMSRPYIRHVSYIYICSVFNICSAPPPYTTPSPCSSPLFPLHASRWACFPLQTDRQERWSTHSITKQDWKTDELVDLCQQSWNICDAGWACYFTLLIKMVKSVVLFV